MTRLAALMLLTALPFVPLLGRAGDIGDAANLTGLGGALCLWWQVLLGIRQVSERLSDDRLAVVALHRWLGGCGAFLVLLHPLLEMISLQQDLAYLAELDFTWVESTYTSLGRIALGLFLLLWLSSTLLRAAVRHRLWRFVHYVSYPLAGLVLLHAWGVGSYLAELPWLRAYWLGLAAVLALAVAWRAAVPLWTHRYRLAAAEALSPTVTEYTLAPAGRGRARGRGLRPPRPGQFCYLRLRAFSRAHPFSVVRQGEDGRLTFAVKSAGPFTARLARLAPGAVLRLDGPYGTFTREAHEDDRPAVLVAGGIGVTPFVDLVRRHAGPHMTLRHLVSSPAEAVYREELRDRLGPRYEDAFPRDLPLDRRARYFVCGSPGFIAATTARLRTRGVPREQVFTEQFDC
ncbi:ferric reductase-like transmembrane domain-containing protein [Streptomyces sp. DSM 44917]|uniref:Ferric reductase-like transmembrane domain-containing protein n=1 Tax=Streptomyces boetiae TaxID=3075541 RepID=A0ABU2L4H6_9ACTN|nr:ferric reductase-like transmembrane domain-containing protein [Streptomyces sp. DSM 44917]MDT0306435.1 ferric reductase-like transmembrane domain-containing protein [Streptomyces sp. DSM 44917]